MVSAGNPNPSFRDRLLSYVFPAVLLSMAIWETLLTVLSISLVERDLAKFLRPWEIQGQAFGNFWLKYGESTAKQIPSRVEEYLQDLYGVVLDVGPGSGELLNRFDHSKVQAAYGAEPGVSMHPKLLQYAQTQGWSGRYHALACGAEPESLIPALAKEGLLNDQISEAVFDNIVCLRVLCGVPRPEETVAELYKLLRPGGRLIFMEHVVNPWRSAEGSIVSRALQLFYSGCGWKYWMGNCHMQRDTGRVLIEVGGKSGWADKELFYSDGWGVLPFLCGVLTKAS